MPAYLRHKPTGDLYIATDLLLARTDMEEITAKQAAGIKSATTREKRLSLAQEAKEKAKETTKVAKTKGKKAVLSEDEAEAAALAENDKA